MQRFFSPSQNILDKKIIIKDKKQAHHLKDVLRLKIKDEVVIFDEQGNEYECLVSHLSDKVGLDIKAKRVSSQGQKNTVKITVACAIPKNSKMDDIIDKLTQLGVAKIIPLETTRVIVRLNPQEKEKKLLRWQKVVLSASQQSQRMNLAVLEPIKDIKEVLLQAQGFDLKLIPTLIDERKSIKEVLSKSCPKNILVFIGPEGDFTPEEVDLAKKAGCIPVTLGDLVLRVETAAVAVVSYISLWLR